MLNLVTNKTIQRHNKRIIEQDFANNSRRVIRTLQNPGGAISNAEVMIRRDIGIWAYFHEEESTGFLIAYGEGEPNWQMDIQINIPLGRNLHKTGQLVSNDIGDIFIAHKGMLGGGKHNVTIKDFSLLIDGFKKSSVKDGKRALDLFIIAKIGQDGYLNEIARYVKEAKRIREIERSGNIKSKIDEILKSNLPNKNENGGFYDRKSIVEFSRRHAKVENELTSILSSMGLNLSRPILHGGIQPDLVAKKNSDGKTILFEIKVLSDPQSAFTAIGQLHIYSEGIYPKPVLVYVAQSLPESRLFSKYFDENYIKFPKYFFVGDQVIFEGLESII